MCGFWVSVGLDPDPSRLDAIQRRGPDGSGWQVFATPSGPLAFGHRRLGITDPSDRSAQPFSLEHPGGGDRLHLVWNGAVYDFRMRQEFWRSRTGLRTTGDTEVLAQHLAHYGAPGLNELDSAFALAAYEPEHQRLTLARDRFGEKPLFYAFGQYAGRPWFCAGSNLWQFRDLPGLTPEINRATVAGFLNFAQTESTDSTFLAHVHRLAPGHVLEIDLTSATAFAASIAKSSTAWLKPASVASVASSEDARREVRGALVRSIEARINSSDVGYGLALSGGLDSSIVAGLIRQREQGRSPLCMVAMVTDEEETSERPYIDALRRELGLDITEVCPDAATVAEVLDDVLTAQGEPFPSTSLCGQYLVFRTAHALGAKVMIGGQGADELFGGYPFMMGARLADILRRRGPAALFNEARTLAADGADTGLAELLHLTLRAMVPETVRRTGLALLGKWPPRGLIADGPLPAAEVSRTFEDLCRQMTFERSLPKLLRFEDGNAHHFGIESRLPYLSPSVSNLALAMDGQWRVRDGWRKAPLHDIAVDAVPALISQRRSKLGYSVPHKRWMAGEVGHLCRQWVGKGEGLQAAGVLKTGAARRTLDDNALFRAAIFLRWAERFGATLG